MLELNLEGTKWYTTVLCSKSVTCHALCNGSTELTRVCDAAIQKVAQECLAAVSDWVLPNL
jgi:hypothetical protein